MAAQNVPPDTTPEEEFDLFGPGPPVVRLLVCRQVEVPVAVLQLEKETRLLVGLLRQSLQQNQQMMQQNQQLVATMLRRMDLEEERRNKTEKKVAETAEAAKKAAEAALTRDPFDPRAAASSVDPGDKVSGSGFGGSNRAEKYLPPLPLIDHHVMEKKRMKEVEGWHTFLETLSSWLACRKKLLFMSFSCVSR